MNGCMGASVSNRINPGSEGSSSSEDFEGKYAFEKKDEIIGTFFIYIRSKDAIGGEPLIFETWQEADFSLKKSGELDVKKNNKKIASYNIIEQFNYSSSRVGNDAVISYKPSTCTLVEDKTVVIAIPRREPNEPDGVSTNLWLYFPTKRGLIIFVEFCARAFYPDGSLGMSSTNEVSRIKKECEEAERRNFQSSS